MVLGRRRLSGTFAPLSTRHLVGEEVSMGDPRLDIRHLGRSRWVVRYEAAINEMLDDRGPVTTAADPLARPPRTAKAVAHHAPLPPGGTYTLVSLADGRRHSLRVGINTVGRCPENDLVLAPLSVSRRHCVVLVHATGGCAVYDTASRQGIWVNQSRTTRADLLPGDVLRAADQEFLLGWVGPDGGVFHAAQGAKTVCGDGSSATEQVGTEPGCRT
jgi:hypothetical protein